MLIIFHMNFWINISNFGISKEDNYYVFMNVLKFEKFMIKIRLLIYYLTQVFV